MAQYKHYKKALSLIQEQKFDEALELYNLALEAQPDDPDILNDRGVCFFHLKKMSLALQDLTRAVELQPDYSYRYSARAFVKGVIRDTEGAISDYEMAVKLDPKDEVAHNNLGMLH
ncbi:MAG: tetratricopeptide repeat protein, partial [Flavobacteriales bacterium]|nr:tetratricopeptide repeat protein [Flavobacteriales bacterium]